MKSLKLIAICIIILCIILVFAAPAYADEQPRPPAWETVAATLAAAKRTQMAEPTHRSHPAPTVTPTYSPYPAPTEEPYPEPGRGETVSYTWLYRLREWLAR